ncbi:MAG: hypothetical protein ACRDOI_34805 [Trebonia sp.]
MTRMAPTGCALNLAPDRSWLASACEPGEAAAVAARVAAAQDRAALRLAATPWRANAEVPRDELLRRFMPEGGGREPIGRAADLGMVSDLATADVLRVAWTIGGSSAGGPPPGPGPSGPGTWREPGAAPPSRADRGQHPVVPPRGFESCLAHLISVARRALPRLARGLGPGRSAGLFDANGSAMSAPAQHP